MTTVDALILCHNRPDEVREAVASLDPGFAEVIVLDNGSTPPVPDIAGARLVRSDENLGVTGGRNRLLAESSAELAVFIDDDAVACTPLSGPVIRRFDHDPELAVLALRITRPDGPVPLEHPFRGRPCDVERSRPCAYFVGAGYAVRSAAVRAVGGYDEELFYSTEEIDLSMSLLHEGWGLFYDADLRVEHRPSARGRAIAPMVPAMTVRNRIVYARRHLAAPVAVVHVGVWIARSLPLAVRAGAVRRWASAVVDGLRRPVRRRPPPLRRHREIHQLGGRVLY